MRFVILFFSFGLSSLTLGRFGFAIRNDHCCPSFLSEPFFCYGFPIRKIV